MGWYLISMKSLSVWGCLADWDQLPTKLLNSSWEIFEWVAVIKSMASFSFNSCFGTVTFCCRSSRNGDCCVRLGFGFSAYIVPSLSRTAILFSGGTYAWLFGLVILFIKPTIVSRVSPSFQEGRIWAAEVLLPLSAILLICHSCMGDCIIFSLR